MSKGVATLMIGYLRTLCWAASVGGEHYTAEIKIEGEDYELKYALSGKQAAKLNKKDGHSYGITHFAGDMSNRFWTLDQVFDNCIDKYSDKVTMIVHARCAAAPRQVIYCEDQELKDKLNELWLEAEKLYDKSDNPYLRYSDQMDRLESEWDKLIKPHRGY